MPIKNTEPARAKVEFENATLADLIEAVEDLRSRVPADATIRVRTTGFSMDRDGLLLRSITAIPPTTNETR